ncbi:radical SAM protein [Desulfogranum japonicum]|uniref:radical SAM protein n=1 Tax=Desulfogranum japonicum TaxID=231447 RepID=UPI000411F412|nr:radical SAM protein [Desulfogranum japonicum]
MKPAEQYRGFEQGPIRPPSEAESLLIRVTRNCPWNRCSFCPVYKNSTFSRRPIDHVLRDIDTVRMYTEAIVDSRKSGLKTLPANYNGFPLDDQQALHAAYQFVAGGMQSIFIQDGNSLIIHPDDFIRILKHLQNAFPMVKRVTSYGRSHTIARIDDHYLLQMAEAGLNRIHIGMESGSDKVLKLVNKGSDKATQILAGQKVKAAGIELSEYYMPGLGGKPLWEENASETADALNQINPDFIRLRTLALPPAAPLTRQFQEGKFIKMGDVDTARELLLFLESLEGITSTIRSDHVLNLFPEIDGTLPESGDKLQQTVRDFLVLPKEEQLLFCIGRRTHRMARLDDLTNPQLRRYTEQMRDELGATVENMDSIIDALMQRFI